MIITSIDVTSAGVQTMSDPELVAAMCRGQTEALDLLFMRYARLVYKIAADILKDGAEAEDSTQEVFFEIYRKASLYDPARGSVRSWLLQYAYRRTVRRKLLLARRAAYRGEPIEAVDALHQHQPRLTRDECGWVLRSGLAQLTERQRTTLELTCFEDLTLRDVAERLGVSVGCTRHYYYRGLARLQQWARLTHHPRPGECRAASRAGRPGGAKARARQPHDRP